MKANFKRAVSFVMALLLCLTYNIGYAAAESSEKITGAQPRPGISGIDSVELLEVRDDGMGGKRLYAVGHATALPDVEEGYEYEIYMQLVAPTGGKTNSSKELTADRFENVYCMPEAGSDFEDGYYSAYLRNTDFVDKQADSVQKGFRVSFYMRDNEVVVDDPLNPPWEDIHEDYQLSVTPGSVTLEDSRYLGSATPAAIKLSNSGWNGLNGVVAAVSGAGLILSPDPANPISSLASGATQEYTLTPDTNATPGAYRVTLEFTSDEIDAASAAAVTIDFQILKATQAAIENWDTEAATTDGGLGKIKGLSGSAVYEYGVEPYGEDDWSSFTTEADGTFEITPGAYKLRLPENDYYAAGIATEEVLVPAFYHFKDAVISDMKAGVETNYPVCDLVTGGIGDKTYVVTAGALPTGLSLSRDGYITGSATVVTTGSFVIQVEVTDSNADGPESRMGTITIEGIAKGDQATPEAMDLNESDVFIVIQNWEAGQEYAASTDAAITAGGMTWVHWNEDSTEIKALTGLLPNTNYIVFTRAMESELLNPSVIVTAPALTLKTTIAAVSISGSGILNEWLEAVVSPAAATADYNWMNADGETIATTPSIQVSSDMMGKEIRLEVTGKGDYQGTIVTDPYLVGGCKVSVLVSSYDPKKAVMAVLTSADGTLSFSAVSATASGIGNAAQTVTLSGVNPNITYDLTLQKAGHTNLVIKGITLGNDDLAITSAGGMTELRLYCGDFNGDNAVRLQDRGMLLRSAYFGKAVADFAGDGEKLAMASMLDVDGDGYIKFNDLQIVMSAENYGRTGVLVNY